VHKLGFGRILLGWVEKIKPSVMFKPNLTPAVAGFSQTGISKPVPIQKFVCFVL